jgi:hypothetical protein
LLVVEVVALEVITLAEPAGVAVDIGREQLL